MSGERLLPQCIVSTVKFGGGGVMVWSCFSWYVLQIIHGTFNFERYKDILDNRVVPTLRQFFGNDDCFCQNDNSPCFSLCQAVLCTHGCKSSSMVCSEFRPQPNR